MCSFKLDHNDNESEEQTYDLSNLKKNVTK